MLLRTLFLFLLFSSIFVTAQDQIPSKEELLGNWSLSIKDFRSEVREYVLRPLARDSDRYNEKVQIRKAGISKSFNLKGIRCGNDHRIRYNRGYKYGKTSWKYNSESGILKISARHVLYGTLFSVKKTDSGWFILTVIE